MKYMGSKNTIAKELLLYMVRGGRPWVEPFVGGANMIDKVDGIRIGYDNNEYLISLLIAARDGWTPPVVVSKDLYYQIKKCPMDFPKHLVGFVGFLCSFGGKWWGGYAFDNVGSRNYAREGSCNLVNQSKNLIGAEFRWSHYEDIVIDSPSCIYCDPPYKGTTKYGASYFDHDRFCDWCILKAKQGHFVYVSEYDMPHTDFLLVHQLKKTSFLSTKEHMKSIEKLFICIPDNLENDLF